MSEMQDDVWRGGDGNHCRISTRLCSSITKERRRRWILVKLKVVCQVCFRRTIIDTSEDNEWYLTPLNEVVSDIPEIWEDYYIWICDKCMKRAGMSDYTCNWKQLEEMVKKSLFGGVNE